MIPLYLEKYDVFGSLSNWAAGEQSRRWVLMQWRGQSVVQCVLTWGVGEQVASFAKVAESAQEAVYLALEEFSLWQRRRA